MFLSSELFSLLTISNYFINTYNVTFVPPFCGLCLYLATRRKKCKPAPLKENGIMAKRLGKRKIGSESRVFNPKWTNDYFFVQCKEKAVCLICQEAVAVFKEYNLRRHYESRHKDKYDSLQGQMRVDKLSKLKSGMLAQQNAFVRICTFGSLNW